jgi:hypothetical protein
VQLAKIVMMVNQPLQQTANVLSALLRDLGSMLAQVITKKESGELPGGTGAAEAATEEPVAEAAPAETPPATEETLENEDVGPGAEADDDATDNEESTESEEGKE